MAQLKDIMCEVFGAKDFGARTPDIGGKLTINIHEDGVAVTFEQLRRLSELLGTSDIAIFFEPETPAYSDTTGGDPAKLELHINGIAADLEWEQDVWRTGEPVSQLMAMRRGLVSMISERPFSAK